MFTMEYSNPMKAFIESDHRNLWIYYTKLDLKIYVRKSERSLYHNHKLQTCFDIASIEITSKKNRGKGYFTRLLDHLEPYLKELNQFDAIFVECIINERLPAYLEKRGYKQFAVDWVESVNYYLPLK